VTEWYRKDVAYIHDVGHADFALQTAPGILEILAESGVSEGLVVDLGCGSGLLARELLDAGYGVLGIDISEAMVELARGRAPEAEFRVGSLFNAEIPPCAAATAIGEVLNYLFDSENEDEGLGSLFGRVHDALVPGGAFVFDVLGPGQVPEGVAAKTFRVGEDWAVLSEKEEDSQRRTLTRRITSFLRVGERYRRDDEVHRLRLYGSAEIARELLRAGFRVQTMRAYGRYPLPRAHTAFVARKADL
jgi:SAM-dependent methyltransferase